MSGRIGWLELPAHVRAGVERILGEPVVSAASQQGGFSPGSADRVVLASGGSAFVKAVSADVNETAAALHRREAAVTARLPAGVPAPELLGKYDDGTWVALILAEVPGWHPREPWEDTELRQVLDALAAMTELPVPEEAGLPRYEATLERAFMGWEKLQRRPLVGLDPWTSGHLEQLAMLAQRGVAELAGAALVHGDLRTDNILLTDQGAVMVDWPWAAVGSPWADALSVLVNVKTLNPAADVEQWLRFHPVFAEATADAVTAVLAGWAGYFMDMSRRPAPPGITTLREFQRRQADVLTAWLGRRCQG